MADNTDLRPYPPPLEMTEPLCPMCGERVEHDGDDYACYRCDAYWAPQTAGHEAGIWAEQLTEAARQRGEM